MSRVIYSSVFLGILLLSLNARGDSHCETGTLLNHGFESGAAWTACAVLDDMHGLEIQSLNYRSPGDVERTVIRSLHPAQLLMHYHNAADPIPQIGVNIRGDTGLGGLSVLAFDSATCSGDLLPVNTANDALCVSELNTGVLAKFGQRPAVHGARWQIELASQRDSLVWTTAISLHEDGTITPQISLSGIGSVFDDHGELIPATILASWRVDFLIDGPTEDRIEEFNFPLSTGFRARRPMQVTPLDTESLRKVNRQAFRGWRVRDGSSGKGYYLDPANSGYAYTSRSLNWAQFDVAFTRSDDCERHALHNSLESNNCGGNLDEFVNGEALSGTITLWHQQSRIWQPRREDTPAISTITTSFDLLPFDWTARSPFDLGEP